MPFWKGKKVLVTGGAGFIGSYVVEMLLKSGARVRVADYLSKSKVLNLASVIKEVDFLKADLRDSLDCRKACRGMDIVLNLAARVGGINFNKLYPGTIFRDNILISTNMLEAARISNVERVLVASSACVYPHFCKIPTPESEGFSGIPEPTNDGYGWAKRMAEFQAQAYARQFGMKIAIVRPYNAYGPRDHFDIEKSHVIAALIARICKGENPLRVWGNGRQSRSFLYVSDFARGVLEATQKYAVCDPLNLGSEEEIKIRDLVELIVRLSGKKIGIVFDTSKPAGQPRRSCDVTKAKKKIGFKARVKLAEGLDRTITWCLENKNRLSG